MDLKVWILSGVIGAGSVLLWWIIRKAIDGVYARLDRMIEQNEETGKMLVEHGNELKSLDRRINVNENRLNDHAKRIRQLEINKQ
ncbi:hypothetical protein [Mangrovibacterium marinum]|nr:hypothetical protein [Mangrovibacterium marinum]